MQFIAYHIAFTSNAVLLIYASRKALHNDNREWCVLIVGSPLHKRPASSPVSLKSFCNVTVTEHFSYLNNNAEPRQSTEQASRNDKTSTRVCVTVLMAAIPR